MTPQKTRWQEITEIWREYTIQYRFLILVVLVIFGFWLFGSNILALTDMRLSYTTNVFTEALSIAVTVLIIEFFNRAREKRDQNELQKRLDEQELTRLKALLGSNENVVTKIAIAELRAKGWLRDGTLKWVRLGRANLEGADLKEAQLVGAKLEYALLKGAELYSANLAGTDLFGANLSEADFFETELAEADLSGANLAKADLTRANLERTNLSDSNLIGAYLLEINLEEAVLFGTILPDGTEWTEEVDMGRFINEEHPEYEGTLEKINEIREQLKDKS